MADMGTKEASELWGVSQKQVEKWCREKGDRKVITQDKKGSPWHIPKDFPNPFTKERKESKL